MNRCLIHHELTPNPFRIDLESIPNRPWIDHESIPNRPQVDPRWFDTKSTSNWPPIDPALTLTWRRYDLFRLLMWFYFVYDMWTLRQITCRLLQWRTSTCLSWVVLNIRYAARMFHHACWNISLMPWMETAPRFLKGEGSLEVVLTAILNTFMRPDFKKLVFSNARN